MTTVPLKHTHTGGSRAAAGQRVWNWLVKPPDHFTERDRRRARLLAVLLLGLLVLIAASFVGGYLANRAYNPLLNPITLVAAVAAGLLALAYGLNRTGRYVLAARLTVLIAAVGAWAAVLVNRASPTADPLLLAFLVVSVLLSSILLTVRETALISLAHFLGLILLYPRLPSAWIFVSFLSGLLLLAAWIVQSDLVQINRQAREIAKSERWFRALIENSSDAVALLSPDGQVLYQSPAAARILGFPLEELLQHSPLAQLHPDDRPVAEALLGTILREPERVLTAQLRAQHADGSWRLLEFTGRNLLAEPAVKAIVGNYHDITELVRTEESLRESEERFRLAARATQDMIWDWNILSGDAMFSAAFEHVLGYPPERIGRDRRWWAEHIHPEDRAAVLGSLQTAHDTGELAWNAEYQFERAGGSYAFVSDHASIVRGGMGEPVRMVGSMSDFTERRLAQERVLKSAARAEALARVASRLNAQLDLGAVLSAVCEEAAAAMQVAAAAVSLYDPHGETIQLAAACGDPSDPSAGPEAAPRPVPRAEYELWTRPNGAITITTEAPVGIALSEGQVGVSLMRDGQLTGRLDLGGPGADRPFGEDELALLRGLADQAAQAIANARLFAEAQRRLRHTEALRAIDIAIASSPDLQRTLSIVLNQVTSLLQVDAADVLLLNAKTLMLDFATGQGFRTAALRHTHLAPEEGFAGRAVAERMFVQFDILLDNADGFTRAPLMHAEGFVFYCGIPLIAKDEVKGVLEIFHRTQLAPDLEWLSLLEALAGQAAIAIDNVTLFESLQDSNQELALAYDATIEGWSRALDLRDHETEGHSQRVTEMALRLAGAMGLTGAELAQVRWGALLHDIGKMGIPDAVLLKPGPLNEAEWTLMKLHPVHAYQMLSPIHYLRPALDIAYCHHEKWDGTGYPRGLKGEEIPLTARIFAVVDVWDALCSDRTYRSAWPKEQVIEHIRNLAGVQFDPAVVRVFLDTEVPTPHR